MARDWSKLAGRFLVFDGPDGSGKSTQFRRFADEATAGGLRVCEVREPGGTPAGEAVRKLLLDPAYEGMDLTCEMLLYMASRAELVANRIKPALARGELVLADRFISSTLAYQGTAGGLNLDDIRAVGGVAVGETWPDTVVIFDVDTRTAQRRMNPLLREREFDTDLDRIEMRGSEYHAKVRRGYLDQAEREPERYVVVDATADEETVYERLLAGVGVASSC